MFISAKSVLCHKHLKLYCCKCDTLLILFGNEQVEESKYNLKKKYIRLIRQALGGAAKGQRKKFKSCLWQSHRSNIFKHESLSLPFSRPAVSETITVLKGNILSSLSNIAVIVQTLVLFHRKQGNKRNPPPHLKWSSTYVVKHVAISCKAVNTQQPHPLQRPCLEPQAATALFYFI